MLSLQKAHDIFLRKKLDNPKICMESQKTPNSQKKNKKVLRKKDRARGIRLPDFSLYYKAIVIQTT